MDTKNVMNCYLNATINSKLVLIIIFASLYIQMVYDWLQAMVLNWRMWLSFISLPDFLTTAQLFWTDDTVSWMHIDIPILRLSST